MADKADIGQTIGAVARAAGVHVETVRYYERIGLLPRPPRAQGTLRRYPAEALQRVRFIKRAQWLGFSLEEVAMLLELAGKRGCNATRAMGEKKLALLRVKLDELAGVQTVLETLLSACASNQGTRCPLIDTLLRDDQELSSPAAQAARPQAGTRDSISMGESETGGPWVAR